MRKKYFLFVHHTTSIWEKLSTWCFEHPGDISCSLLVNPSYTDESWEGRNTCLWILFIYIFIHRYIFNHYIVIINMDSINFGCSMKNIPPYSKSSYLYKLIGKVEKVLKRIKWKAIFFDRDQANSNTNGNNNIQY